MNKFIVISSLDNVMIALTDIEENEIVNGIKILSKIDKGHKIAIKDIKKGENIIKYGSPIGHANENIKKGEWVHTHNVGTNLGEILSYEYSPKFEEIKVSDKKREVNVYKRKNGTFGIRNELWIVPTVGCITGQLRQIAKAFEKEIDTELSTYDGIQVFSHPYGCSQMGDDLINTKETLQNIAMHPNAGAVLIVGLGCENNQIEEFKKFDYDKERTKFLILQEVDDEVSVGVLELKKLYNLMIKDKRERQPISVLNIGLECGGSDGFSGITGNPLLGKLSDYVNFHGGTTVLTEVPEMFGAEQILMRRAKDKETFDKVVDLINDFKNYYKTHNQVIYDNPSPGNKKGGITTLEDKSLGCTQKAGLGQVRDVLKHTERLKTKGLNLLSAPGNDLVATTALGMSGCQMVLFTTGRGTPFGGFIPTLKISTNTELYAKKPNWIDFNAGFIADGKNIDDVLESLLDYVVEIANGKKSKNEINDFREIAIFKDGVVL